MSDRQSSAADPGPQGTPTTVLDRLGDEGRQLLFTEARTAYAFSETPVSDAELRDIWELARWAPTSANVQPLRVLYVRTPEGKERLLPHIGEGNRAKSASAPVVAVLAEDTRFHEHIPTVFPLRPEMRDRLENDEAARTRMGHFSASLQVGYFILAVRAAGLAAGPMAGFDAAGVDAEFFADGRWRSLLVVNIGHPAGPSLPRLPRLEPDHVLSWA
jgi:3-hydroxypropanoate dehydrogenase